MLDCICLWKVTKNTTQSIQHTKVVVAAVFTSTTSEPFPFFTPGSKPSVLLWSLKMQKRPCSAKAGQSTKSANLKPNTLMGIQYLITENNFKTYHKMSKLRQVCKEPLLRLGIQCWMAVSLSSAWLAARHVIIPFRISTHHFFLLHRLVSSSHVFLWFENQRNAIRISVIFKPQKYSTSTHLAWQHCHGFEFQIRKAKPANCTTPSADLWNIDYGMKRYMCCILLLGQWHILHNEWLGKWRLQKAQWPMRTTCRTQEGISRFFGTKTVQNSAM